MTKEDLLELKRKLSKLSEEESKERDLYLRQLALGEIQGPSVGYASIDKPWLKYYNDLDIMADIPKMSIFQYMSLLTSKYDNQGALEYMGKTITYKEFKENILKSVKSLKKMGVKPGNIVSVCLPNIPEVGYIFYSINYLGAIANMMDPRTNESTLIEQVDDSKSELLITLDTVIDKFIDTSVKNIVSVSALNSFPKTVQILAKLKDKSLVPPKINDERIIDYSEFINFGSDIDEFVEPVYNKEAPAVIAYTGGTTGVPKGVIVTNEAFNAMIVENSVIDYNIECGDRALNMAPPWTYYGLSNCFNSYLCMGVKSVLIPTFGPDDLGKIILKYKPNHIITVPSALIAVMKERKLRLKKMKYVKTIIVGADKLDSSFENKFNDFLRECESNTSITKGYGMTEVCAAASYTISDVNENDTVGIPFLFEKIGIYNPNDINEELQVGIRGEIAIQGPKNMLGYFGVNEESSNHVLKQHSDGSIWAHTGDIGYINPDGKLFIVGRLKRMFVRNGFKIFPGEIEKQILNNSSIQQTAVISVDDESNGLATKAYVVLSDKFDGDSQDLIVQLQTQLKSTLYDYELPDYIEIIDELPLTGMNKIDYNKLEELNNQKVKRL